ncbi:ADP-ribosyltransferase [Bacillus mycoides]|uniref:ADP-ribosyltransferase n=1 Tax=Bacillus mycoides TaxID=1405 RepID=UPI00119ED9FA|nr:ADP-ribosyltransferase [Bacillus mycoides]
MINKTTLTKLVLSLGVAASQSAFFGNVNVRAAEQINFSKNDKTAEEWANNQYSRWTFVSSSDERNALHAYTTEFDVYNAVNKYLEKNSWIANSKLDGHIKNMDSMLKKSGPTQQELILYKKINVSELNIKGLTTNTDLRATDNLNPEALKKLQMTLNKNPVLKYKSYLDTALTQEQVFSNSVPAFLEIHVPKNSTVGIMNTSHVVLPRNSSIKITNVEIVSLKEAQFKGVTKDLNPKQFVRIKTELIK